MRTILTSSLILILFFKMYGQQDPERVLLELKTEKARKMKSGGAALVVLGSILVISGAVTMADNFSWSSEGKDNFKAGGIMFACGAGSLGAGIPLTVVGARRHRNYKRRLEAVSVGVNLAPQQRGMSITYRF